MIQIILRNVFRFIKHEFFLGVYHFFFFLFLKPYILQSVKLNYSKSMLKQKNSYTRVLNSLRSHYLYSNIFPRVTNIFLFSSCIWIFTTHVKLNNIDKNRNCCTVTKSSSFYLNGKNTVTHINYARDLFK